jgi:uncharacterized glyoxalase superfamily protein PhnB
MNFEDIKNTVSNITVHGSLYTADSSFMMSNPRSGRHRMVWTRSGAVVDLVVLNYSEMEAKVGPLGGARG